LPPGFAFKMSQGLSFQLYAVAVADVEVRKGVSEMSAYLEEFAGDAATQLAARLDEVDVNSSSAAANGGPAPSEGSDQAIEQALGASARPNIPERTYAASSIEYIKPNSLVQMGIESGC